MIGLCLLLILEGASPRSLVDVVPEPGSRNLTVDQTRQQEKRSYVLIFVGRSVFIWLCYAYGFCFKVCWILGKSYYDY
ncbi:hypothetical protein OIU77_014520 [Salix suchowensis]|uniref:Uncharacterized protein n=1 Tax=Salix suchowensis TaxID=1278906 RepID=A0ABQ8ZXZ4_9ROSI|nr:hypothetical protein OIU77_014520 [Salix suchowensis]